MQSEKNSLAERVLRDLEAVLRRDNALEEFVIIPSCSEQNKSPVIHEQHNLALESWCVKYVFNYAYHEVLQIRKLIGKKKLSSETYDSINRMVLGVLLINPDVATFWNIRRHFICDNLLDIYDELRFTKLVLSHKAKSNETFAYRKWLIRRLLEFHSIDQFEMNRLVGVEREVCMISAEKCQNNYHAWTQRIWCMESVVKCDLVKWLPMELEWSLEWVQKHISEHAGFHYRMYLVNKLQEVKCALPERYFGSLERLLHSIETINTPWNEVTPYICALIHELELTNQLLEHYSEHETIWYYRRHIHSNVIQALFQHFGIQNHIFHHNLDVMVTNEEKKGECNIVECEILDSGRNLGDKLSKSVVFNALVVMEKKFLEKFTKLDARTKYLACRHHRWLHVMLGYDT